MRFFEISETKEVEEVIEIDYIQNNTDKKHGFSSHEERYEHFKKLKCPKCSKAFGNIFKICLECK